LKSTAALSTLATYIGDHFGVVGTIAAGIASAALILIVTATKGAFCDMTVGIAKELIHAAYSQACHLQMHDAQRNLDRSPETPFATGALREADGSRRHADFSRRIWKVNQRGPFPPNLSSATL
jgi:hypothetical protein